MHLSFTSRLLSALVCCCALVSPAWAQSTMDHSKMGHAAMASPASTLAEGEVKKIDTKAQTITLKHGEIKNLGMGAMTMAFKAKSADLLTQVKVGDKVKFKAEMDQGALTVIAIGRAP